MQAADNVLSRPRMVLLHELAVNAGGLKVGLFVTLQKKTALILEDRRFYGQ